jgi:putative ATP-binding cassette transporter
MPQAQASSTDLFLGPNGLLRRHALGLGVATLAGVGGSAATVALLALINRMLHAEGGLASGLALTFVGLALLTLAGRVLSDALTNRIGQDILRSLRTRLAQRILAAPIDELERFRTHRLTPVLTHDIGMVSGLCLGLPMTVVSATIVLGCLGWLVWLSWQLAALLAVVMAGGIAIHRLALERAIAGFDAAREGEDALHKAWRRLGDAAKELRLSRGRRAQVYQGEILRSVDDIRQASVKAGDAFSFAHEAGSALYFLFIAVVFGAARFWNLSAEALSGFVLALLYLKGPMDQVLGFLPFFARARVALGRVAELTERFESPEPGLADAVVGTGARPAFAEAIALSGVRYAFAPAEAEEGAQAAQVAAPFVFGPIDLRIARGEILFIAGDNGSGKTTFLKLLTGLYLPQSGTLTVDGEAVTDASRDTYRQLFSPVLSDFHLFEALTDEPGLTHAQRDDLARAGLARLALEGKVAVNDGAFSTIDLSTGQRKRLALVHAWVEARPVMVFDEWAADQDPSFRHQFYTELLPELRAKGHTLVVISHDDRYFGVADRVVHFRDGRIAAA